jgi:gliding motility-associated lipoprotein GldH
MTGTETGTEETRIIENITTKTSSPMKPIIKSLISISKGIKSNSLIVIAVLLLTTSCKMGKVVYEDVRDIPKKTWKYTDTLVFNVPIQDTLQSYNVMINLRNTGLYPHSNIYLFVTTIAPSGASLCDTIEYTLADLSGKWTGKGWGDVWSNEIPYRKNIRFPYKGIYTFKIEHGMRILELPEILDVGIRIEKAQ